MEEEEQTSTDFMIELLTGEIIKPHPLLMELSPVLQAAVSKAWQVEAVPFKIPVTHQKYQIFIEELLEEQNAKINLRDYLGINKEPESEEEESEESEQPPSEERHLISDYLMHSLVPEHDLLHDTLYVVLDKVQKWYVAKPFGCLTGRFVTFHFLGWSPATDESIPRNVQRIRYFTTT